MYALCTHFYHHHGVKLPKMDTLRTRNLSLVYIYVHVRIEMLLLRYYSIEHAYVQHIQTVQDRYQYIECVRSYNIIYSCCVYID